MQGALVVMMGSRDEDSLKEPTQQEAKSLEDKSDEQATAVRTESGERGYLREKER